MEKEIKNSMSRPKIIKSARGVYEVEQSEEHVIVACRNLLELNGARVFRIRERIPWGKTHSEPGIPDTFGWWPAGKTPRFTHLIYEKSIGGNAVHFYIEFKKPGKFPTSIQAVWIDRAVGDGVFAMWVDSVEMMRDKFAEYGVEIKGL